MLLKHRFCLEPPPSVAKTNSHCKLLCFKTSFLFGTTGVRACSEF
ncbi:hypothetical protein HMPREF9554_00111 [Treponema phagedenis F0421]|nr:hypothetical protein HMPREF9554_00111 [Treponema phagedenis F0421]